MTNGKNLDILFKTVEEKWNTAQLCSLNLSFLLKQKGYTSKMYLKLRLFIRGTQWLKLF